MREMKMRRLILLLALLLAPSLASADFIRYYPPAGGGSLSYPLNGGGTDCTAPAFSFTDDTDAGLCLSAANALHGQSAPAGTASSGLWSLTSTGATFGWYSATSQYSNIVFTDSVATMNLGGAERGSFSTVKFVWNPGVAAGSEVTNDQLLLLPAVAGAGAFIGTLTSTDLTGARTWTFPNVSGTPQLNLVAGTAAPGATECDAANEVGRLYHQTGDPATVQSQLFRCTQTGPASYAWMPAGYQSGTTAPATCTVSNVFFDTDATAGSNWFGCTSANTWTVLGGGMGDPAANGIMVRTAANTSVARTATAGEGVTITNGTGVAGDPTFAADRAVVVFKGTGTADPSASCGDTGDPFQLLDFYLETDTSEIYQCVAIDTWVLSSQLGDDKVIVGSGASAPAVEAIPDCDDTGGNHLNYNTTGTVGSRFSCGTSGDGAGGGGGNITTLSIYEDFISGGDFAGDSNYLGTHGWNNDVINAGTRAGDPGTASNPGLYLLKSHVSSDNSGAVLDLYASTAAVFTSPVAAADRNIDVVIRMGVDGAITSSALWVGFTNSGDSQILDNSRGIWIRRDTDLTDTAFVFAVCNSATAGCQSAGDDTAQKTVVSTITPSDDTSYRFRIRIDKNDGPGSTALIGMRVNDETEKTFCSSGCDDTLGTIPYDNMMFIVAYVTRTTTEVKSVGIDYVQYNVTGLTRY